MLSTPLIIDTREYIVRVFPMGTISRVLIIQVEARAWYKTRHHGVLLDGGFL